MKLYIYLKLKGEGGGVVYNLYQFSPHLHLDWLWEPKKELFPFDVLMSRCCKSILPYIPMNEYNV